MSFLFPFWFGVAAAGVLGAIALHLITTQRPPAAMLPTARFVPEGDARASSRAARPTDLLLLLLRCVALLLLGTAFAGPVTHSRGSSLARVVVADRSIAAQLDTRDSAIALLRAGDALVLFDSNAKVVTTGGADSLRANIPARSRGSLSAALVSARRAAGDLARTVDSVELVIVSPLLTDELDAATAETFARWPGRARLVRTTAARGVSAAIALTGGDADDALAPAIAALNASVGRAGSTTAPVRVSRTTLTAADSTVARDGAAIVYWPRIGMAAPTAQGLWADGATVVAPLARVAIPSGGAVVARWADGAIAATESSLGRGCVRAVSVGVPTAGDISLQPAFMGVARYLLAPCRSSSSAAPVSDSTAKLFSRGGAAATAASLRSSDESSPFAPWLFAAALLLLAGELLVRRGAAAVAI